MSPRPATPDAILALVRSVERGPAARGWALAALRALTLLGFVLCAQCSGRDAAPPGESEVVPKPVGRPAWLGPLEQAHELADQANTPVLREQYTVGVPRGGYWRELLNSDAAIYGGGGAGNFGGVEANPLPAHGRYHSLLLTLPPLAVIVLKPESAR